MAVNHNSEYNTKLCTTLPIENAPKIKVLNDYSEESCLVIDDNDDESHDGNMDQKIKTFGTSHYYGSRHYFHSEIKEIIKSSI